MQVKIIHFEYNDQEKPMMVYFEGVFNGKIFSINYIPATNGIGSIGEPGVFDEMENQDLEMKVTCSHQLFNEEEIGEKCRGILSEYISRQHA